MTRDEVIDHVWSEIDSAKSEIDRLVSGEGDDHSLGYITERCREALTMIERYESDEAEAKAESEQVLRLVRDE